MSSTKEIPLDLATSLISDVNVCVGDLRGLDLGTLLTEVESLASRIRAKIRKEQELDARIFKSEDNSNDHAGSIH